MLSDPSPRIRDTLQNGSIFARFKLLEEFNKRYEENLSSFLPALSGSDLIVCSILPLTQCYSIAEKLGIPCVYMFLTLTYPTCTSAIWSLKPMIPFDCLNKWSHNMLFDGLWSREKTMINKWREKDLGLPEIKLTKGRGMFELIEDKLIIIACSKLICKDQEIPFDYPENVIIKGFPFIPIPKCMCTYNATIPDFKTDLIADPTIKDITEKTNLSIKDIPRIHYGNPKMDPSLVSFLKEAKDLKIPVVYFGFGSMTVYDTSKLIDIATECCDCLNLKGIVAAGWNEDLTNNDLNEQNKNLMVISSAPHDWLFPQMACILHHCGIGTMAAVLRSGKCCIYIYI
jgi:hypothetical protein